MIIEKGLGQKNRINKMTAVALGSFDALHLGHITIIKEMVDYAKHQGLCAAVQLFEVPPKACEGRTFSINTLDRRLEILEKLGVELAIIETFTPQLKAVGYEEFVKEYLSFRYNARAVFVGENYRFGYMARGDAKALTEECKTFGIYTKVLSCVKIDEVVSSTKIREFIEDGNMEKAARYMTRPYAVRGKVVHGRELGRTIGFPTANMNIPKGIILPKDGVYLTRVLLDDESVYSGITNIGAKPTVKDEKQNIETYIDGCSQDLYDRTITVEFLRRIRDIKKFNSLEELKEQLLKDKGEL